MVAFIGCRGGGGSTRRLMDAHVEVVDRDRAGRYLGYANELGR